MYRTHNCGELRTAHIGQEVTLAGWGQRSKDLGGITFLDLRDRYGITQLAFNIDEQPELCQQARKLGREFVIQATGKVIERSSKNTKIPTGEIEIIVTTLNILNAAKLPPFTIEDDTDGGDELRMQYRYLDMRRNPVQQKLRLRNQVALETRKYMDSQGFWDVETPYLIKSTPEGARDFVVPSRMNQGEFYALPQSPQTFKQLLMVSGFDRYYQIVKCFRDEDLRADRQPEFTQIDCETSFLTEMQITALMEELMRTVFKEALDVDLPNPFPSMTNAEAMRRYGSDKPDLRITLELTEVTDAVTDVAFKVFSGVAGSENGRVAALRVPGGAALTRGEIDGYTEFVKIYEIGRAH